MKSFKDIFDDIRKAPAGKPQTKDTKEMTTAKQGKPKAEQYTFEVEGVPGHASEIRERLVDENSDYSLGRKAIVDLGLAETMIYRYDGYSTDISFVPEPEDAHDPDALKVLIENVFIGYVPGKDLTKVKSLLDADGLQTECSFTGGEYKIVHNEGDYYRLRTGKEDIGAKVTLSHKK